MEEPPKKFYRLSPGKEVRLRYAYLMKCTDVIKDANGEIIELHCEIDPDSRGGNAPDGRKVQGTIHWVSAEHCVDLEIRLYDNLFLKENPNVADEGKTFFDNINPDSLKIVSAKAEPYLANAESGDRFQFERLGYFCVDNRLSQPGEPVFNRTVTLKDTWKKIAGS
jgi:glutaminyl-tRNA synthetase